MTQNSFLGSQLSLPSSFSGSTFSLLIIHLLFLFLPSLFHLPLPSDIPLINMFAIPILASNPPFCPHIHFTSHSISFLLAVPAMITSHPNTTMAKKGHVKELNCTARGEWPIIIRWERGDTVIDPDRNLRYSITTSPNEKTDEVLSTLKVGNT